MNSPAKSPDFARVAVHGMTWRYLTFFSGKLMVFISTIVLARLLLKDDFGLVAYALTTIGFLDAITDFGIGPALIYFPEAKLTASTAFWLNLFIRMILFGGCWALAPFAGIYFRDVRVTEVTRILALTFPIEALGDMHNAVLTKSLAFGRSIIPDFIQALTKGIGSIVFAFLGFGVWSLIWGQLAGALASSIILWFVTPWRPSFEFDLRVARLLLSYGVHILGVAVLAQFLQNLDYLLVGRYLGSIQLGVYALAFRLPDLIILQFARIISTVIFPLYAKMRETPGSLARGFYLTTRYVSLITLPLGIGLALIARPFTLIFFTAKWQDAIPVIQALAIYSMLLSLSYNAGSAYKAQGRPQIITWLGLVRLAMLFPALLWAVNGLHSIVAVGWMQVLVAFLGGVLNLYTAARLLELPLSRLAHALYPSMLATAIMSIVIWVALELMRSFPPSLQLTFTVFIGGSVYIGALWIFKRDIVFAIIRNLRQALRKGTNANRSNA